jgi:hypothetical protein
MLRLFHHRKRRYHRVAWAHHAGHGAGHTIPPVHHGGIHLMLAVGCEHCAASGVEKGIILQRNNGVGDGTQRGAASLQNTPPRSQAGPQSATQRVLGFPRHHLAGDHAGSAMDREHEVVGVRQLVLTPCLTTIAAPAGPQYPAAKVPRCRMSAAPINTPLSRKMLCAEPQAS